ncbi:MAG: MarR family winged helix-turn-helix transcriptional regulator [Desertimonas sp.]
MSRDKSAPSLSEHQPPHEDPIIATVRNWERKGWNAGDRLAVSMSIVRVEQILRKAAEGVLRPHGISYSRHNLLLLLYFARNGELPLGKISSRLLVHPTSITTTVDALAKTGLVERVPHPSDRRATLARITDEGRAAVERSTTALSDWSPFELGALTDAEAHTLFLLLQKVRASAGDFDLGSVAEADH